MERSPITVSQMMELLDDPGKLTNVLRTSNAGNAGNAGNARNAGKKSFLNDLARVKKWATAHPTIVWHEQKVEDILLGWFKPSHTKTDARKEMIAFKTYIEAISRDGFRTIFRNSEIMEQFAPIVRFAIRSYMEVAYLRYEDQLKKSTTPYFFLKNSIIEIVVHLRHVGGKNLLDDKIRDGLAVALDRFYELFQKDEHSQHELSIVRGYINDALRLLQQSPSPQPVSSSETPASSQSPSLDRLPPNVIYEITKHLNAVSIFPTLRNLSSASKRVASVANSELKFARSFTSEAERVVQWITATPTYVWYKENIEQALFHVLSGMQIPETKSKIAFYDVASLRIDVESVLQDGFEFRLEDERYDPIIRLAIRSYVHGGLLLKTLEPIDATNIFSITQAMMNVRHVIEYYMDVYNAGLSDRQIADDSAMALAKFYKHFIEFKDAKNINIPVYNDHVDKLKWAIRMQLDKIPDNENPVKKGCDALWADIQTQGISGGGKKRKPAVRPKTAPVRPKTAPVRPKTAPVRPKTAPVRPKQQ